jgi:hypothetical protein
MARGDKDYGDEGKTSFSKKSKLAPKSSPKPQAKPAVSTKAPAAKKEGPMRPKARPLAPASSKRPRTLNDWADDKVKDGIADAKLRKTAADYKKPDMKKPAAKKAGGGISDKGFKLGDLFKGGGLSDKKK